MSVLRSLASAFFLLVLPGAIALSPAVVRAADAPGEKTAGDAKAADAKGGDKQPDLPIKRVVLFSSGVGYFEHQGPITGDAKVELRFPVAEVNDLLKSMVVEDRDGGRVSSVSYGSREPMTRTLRTFSIDLTKNLTLADLLRQVRGEAITVEAPQPITGKIVSVERRKIKVGKDETMEVDVLNLYTPTGLRSITLDTVSQARLLDDKLNSELQQALAILAEASRSDKRTVTIRSTGQGKRSLRVGYIQETPVWKTSYRLVLGDDNKPLLQGWAIVENMTEQDWKDVQLTFVSGRPISFAMDLYQPLYVGRPTVVPELFASLAPRTYDQDLAERAGKEVPAASAKRKGMGGFGGGAFGGRSFGGPSGDGYVANARSAAAPAAAPAPAEALAADSSEVDGQKFDPGQGVASVAAAGNVGELFRYRITQPVTVSRQQSAMLPIVNEKVAGTKVSIYNPAVQPKHPLNGLQLTNSTDLHLMQGPITVYDDNAYAGDAQIADIAPGAQRLISYALDLDVEVSSTMGQKPQMMTSFQIAGGMLKAKTKYTRYRDYTIKSSSKKPRKLLIEQPIDAGWSLTAPKEPSEKSRSVYRFAIDVAPEKKAELRVQEERVEQPQWMLVHQGDDFLLSISSNENLSPKIKSALEEVVKRRRAVNAVDVQMQEVSQRINTVNVEQSRIRANMPQLDRNSELYRRYVKKLSEQEDQVDKLRGQMEEQRAQRAERMAELQRYIAGLDLN